MKKRTEQNLRNFWKIFFCVFLLTLLSGFNTERSEAPGLSQAEKEGLVYVLEEMRMSRELTQLFWDARKLDMHFNILQAESRNLRRLTNFVTQVTGNDPFAHTSPGQFNLAHLQRMYNQFKAQGESSLVASLFVSTTLQESRISLLEQQLDFVANPTMLALYQQQINDAEQLIRGLAQQLNRLNVPYRAQKLEQSRYEAIIRRESRPVVPQAL